MRISRLLMPAVTLAGALALAGCGGGSSGTGTGDGDKDGCGYDTFGGTCYETKAEYDAAVLAAGAAAAEEENEADEAADLAKARYGHLDAVVLPLLATNEAAVAGAPAAQVTAARKAIKAGVGTASSSDGKQHVTVYEMKGQREKTATPSNPGQSDFTSTGDIKITASAFDTNDDGSTKKHTGTQLADDSTMYRVAVSGSYNGASGTYTCTNDAADGCTSRDGGESGIILAGGWAFAAFEGQKEYGAEPRFARYGWWLNEAPNTGNSETKAGAWFGLATGHAAAAVDAAIGTAEYKGKAAGQAALYNSRASTGNVGGAFTADVTLNADFNDDTLSGAVTGFKIGDHSPTWTVKLMERTIDDDGGLSGGTASQLTEWSLSENDSAAAKSGDWDVSFYDKTGTNQPKGVAGGFHSAYGNDGRMVGAFAAEK